MLQVSGWCTVVVGDLKTPNASYAGVLDPGRHVYLSVEAQLSAGLSLASETPLNHFSRKNLGYLYAVRMGATQIFDFDDDNELINASLPEFTVSGAMPAYLLRAGLCTSGWGARHARASHSACACALFLCYGDTVSMH